MGTHSVDTVEVYNIGSNSHIVITLGKTKKIQVTNIGRGGGEGVAFKNAYPSHLTISADISSCFPYLLKKKNNILRRQYKNDKILISQL